MTIPSPEIQIQERLGVAGVREDTRRLAELAHREPPGKALDMGTGTGYIAIWLALHGWDVDATDISPRAVALAQENARLNQARVRIFQSDLFSQVTDRYDVILFNPPMRADETDWTRLVTSFFRRSQTVSGLLMRLTHRRLERARIPFLMDFCHEALEHLKPGGRLLLVISRFEAETLDQRIPQLQLLAYHSLQTIPHAGIAIFQLSSSPTD